MAGVKKTTKIGEFFIKKEGNKKISKADKLEFVSAVLKLRLSVDVPANSQTAMKIYKKIGSQWDDAPMPVAGTDLPDSIEEFYNEIIRAH